MTIHKKNLYSIFYLHHFSIDRSTVNRTSARYRSVDWLPYFNWFNRTCDIDVILTSQCLSVVQILGLDGQGYWKYGCEWKEWNNFFKKNIYRLVSRTTVLFNPRTDLLLEATGSGVKQNCCCPRTQSVTVYMYQDISNQCVYNYTFFKRFKSRLAIGSNYITPLDFIG